MPKQRGAALIVVLSLLTVSLMVGLSSMQSSQIDERLAGNYRAAAEAQMAAEKAASAGLKLLIGGAAEESWAELSVEEVGWAEVKAGTNANCTSPMSCYYRYVEDGGVRYIAAMGGLNDDDDGADALSELLIVEVESAGLVSSPEAAITCIGSSCSLTANNKNTRIDGRDFNADVKTTGKIKNGDVNSEGVNRAAYIFAGVDESGDNDSGSVDTRRATVNEAKINSPDDYENLEGGVFDDWSEAQQQTEADIDNLILLGKSGSSLVTYVDSGNQGGFTMPSSGVVVVDGVDIYLKSSGSFKFNGLIAVKDGGVFFTNESGKGAGTVAVVGAIIASNSTIEMGNGNPSVLYSSESLEDVGAIGGGGGDGSNYNVVSWR